MASEGDLSMEWHAGCWDCPLLNMLITRPLTPTGTVWLSLVSAETDPDCSGKTREVRLADLDLARDVVLGVAAATVITMTRGDRARDGPSRPLLLVGGGLAGQA